MEDSEKKTVMSDHMMDGKQFQFSKRNSYLYRKIKSLQQKTDSNEQEQREKFYSLLPSSLQQEREQHLVSEYFKYLSGVFKKIKQILRLLNSHPLFFVREFLIPCEWLICIQKFWNERGNFYAYVNGAVKFYQRNCPIKGHKREFLLFLRPVTERIEKIKLKDKKKTLPTRWSILLQNLWPWHNTHTNRFLRPYAEGYVSRNSHLHLMHLSMKTFRHNNTETRFSGVAASIPLLHPV